MTAIKEIKAKKELNLEEIVEVIEELTNGLKEGNITVVNGEEYVTFEATDNIQLEIKAKNKEAKSKLSFEIAFLPIVEEPQMPEMIISSEEPVEEVEEIEESVTV